jgi:ferredoxin/flavodoxin---NADP+ reductase
MNRIIRKETLAPGVLKFRIEAPRIARRRKAGQFVILRASSDGERIPLTIAGGDSSAGWIEIVVQVVGAGTLRISRLEQGDCAPDLVGPLGKPTRIELYGKCLCLGGGVGIAPLLPIVRALKKEGNHITTAVGARTRSALILLDEMKASSDAFHVATDDGTCGHYGFVSGIFEKLAAAGETFDWAMIVGPAKMMRDSSALTVRSRIPTWVSLNPIMIDGTGMCGGCRIQMNGETKFGCVDGPEFEASGIDWDSFLQRLESYREFERHSREKERCQLTNRI